MSKVLFTFTKPNIPHKDGDCPFCHKGPITVIEKDINASIIDPDGIPVFTTNMKYSAIGVCLNCNAIVGEYILSNGQYILVDEAPERHIVSNDILSKIPYFDSPFSKHKGDEPYCIIEV